MNSDNEQKEKEIKQIGYPLKTALVSPLGLLSATVLTFSGLLACLSGTVGR